MKISSSNSYFQDLIDWAQEKAKQFIMTGKYGDVNKGDGGKWYGPSGKFWNKSRVARKQKESWTKPANYIPSYWAGYYDRTAFYIRDFVHQSAGAQFLGYGEENYQMLKAFVSLACEETGWYAPWSLNFDGSVYYMDTPNYRRFVRELTGQYELVEVICSLYFLTGDKRYADSLFLEFCERILNDFTDSQDGRVLDEKNSVPEGVGNIWKGSASYNESGAVLAEAGDCIAAMYRAMLLYSFFLKSLGKADKAKEYEKRAGTLKDYFNNEWSVCSDGGYVFGVDKKGKKYSKWTKNVLGIIGAETCFFMPLKELTEDGERNDRLLDEIHTRASDEKTCMPNIESYTYLPQVFFNYKQADRGWYWMKFIGDRKDKPHVKASQGNNGDYPEVSFTLISSAIQGILGFSSDAVSGKIYLSPNLPKDIPDIRVNDLLFGEYTVDITVDGEKITLVNKSEKTLKLITPFAKIDAKANSAVHINIE